MDPVGVEGRIWATLWAVAAVAVVGCGNDGRTYTQVTVPGLGVIKGYLPPDRGAAARQRIPGPPLTKRIQVRMGEEMDRLYREAPRLPDRGPPAARAAVRRAVASALLSEQIGRGCFKPPLAISRVADAWFAGDERTRVIAEANELRFDYDQPQQCGKQRLVIQRWEAVHVRGSRATVALRTRPYGLHNGDSGHHFKERLRLARVAGSWKVSVRVAEDQDYED